MWNSLRIEPSSEKGLLHIIKNGESVKKFINTEIGDYMKYYDALYNAIQYNKPVPVSPIEAMQVIEVIEAILKSNTEKKVIYL